MAYTTNTRTSGNETTGANLLTPAKGHNSIIGTRFRVSKARAYRGIQPELEIVSEPDYTASNDHQTVVRVRNNDNGNEIHLPIRHRARYERSGK